MYEQLFGHCKAIYFRVLDSFGNPEAVAGDVAMLRQVGFEGSDPLFPNDLRLFRGLDFIRDYFTFARRFLGFDLVGLEAVAPRLTAKKFDILLAFDSVNTDLVAAARKEMFSLYAAPAVNLFEQTARQDSSCVPISTNIRSSPTRAARSNSRSTEYSRSSPTFPACLSTSPSSRSTPRPPRAAPRASATPCAACRVGRRSRSDGGNRRPTIWAPTCFSRSANVPIRRK